MPILLLGSDTTGIHQQVPVCVSVLVVLLPMHIEQREESAYDVFEIFYQEMDLVFMGAR